MIDIKNIAKELSINEDRLILEGLKAYIERTLLDVDAEILRIRKKYNVKDIYDMNTKIEEGVLDESCMEDFFRLDRLEHKKEKLEKILILLNG